MQILEREGTYGFKHVLIEKNGEYSAYIDELAKELKGWKLNDLNYEQLVKYHRIKGNREIPYTDFPFIVTIEIDNPNEVLVVNHVSLRDFASYVKAEDAIEYLYSFKLRQVSLVSPYQVREFDYQIPATDILKAMFTLGQVFNRMSDYDMDILEWRKV